MAEETQYTASTGCATISTANSNLNGSGVLGTVLIAAANGTLIKSVSIKATSSTSVGMVRLFVFNGVDSKLLMEIPVPKIDKSGVSPAFETQIILNMTLQSGMRLQASTQNADNFVVIAEGMNWAYYAPSVRPDTTQILANYGRATIDTANSNLNGTGAVETIFTAGAAVGYNGSSIRSITIKSITNVTSGMVRIFLRDVGLKKYLLTEVYVDTDTKSALDEAFERTILFEDDFDLQAGYSIIASTEVAETFLIQVEGTNWNYVA